MMSPLDMPNCVFPSARARWIPVTMVSNGTPSIVCVWGVEEDLHMADIVLVDPLEIRPGQLEEVSFLSKHPGALIVDVEKGLKVVEIIGATDLLD